MSKQQITAVNWTDKKCTAKGRKNQWTVKQLKDYLRANGLKVSGRKVDLCKRVDEHIKRQKPGALAKAKRSQPLPKPVRKKRRGTKKLPALPAAKPVDKKPELQKIAADVKTAFDAVENGQKCEYNFRKDLIPWHERAKKSRTKDWSFLEIPVGTVLFHGTSASFPDNVINRNRAYYASIFTTPTYATLADTGKIISFKVKKQIRLVDFSQKNSIRSYHKVVDRVSKKENWTDMTTKFGKQTVRIQGKKTCRYSSAMHDPIMDEVFQNHLAEQLNVAGWGIGAHEMHICMSGDQVSKGYWHDELMLLNPSEYLTRHKLEIWVMDNNWAQNKGFKDYDINKEACLQRYELIKDWVPLADPDVWEFNQIWFIFVFDGILIYTSNVSRDILGKEVDTNRKWFRLFGECRKRKGRFDDEPIYIPKKNKRSDRFFFNEKYRCSQDVLKKWLYSQGKGWRLEK